MSAPRQDTRQKIQDVARELFAEKGVQRTSLQDIAARLGITKPALYYHFASREDLVRSIVQPLVDGGEEFVTRCERTAGITPTEVLRGYFDYFYAYRADLITVISELSTIADLGLIDSMLAWRERLSQVLFGEDPTFDQSVRSVIALGGLQDCCISFPDAPADELRERAVAAALTALFS
ncbi:TetR/AcrR family transcriptional regulator [Mycobacterium sp. NPDC003323]